MNIWIFNQYAHPPDLPGGTRHCDLGRELVRQGHKVTIFATSFHHYVHRETRLKHREQWKIEDFDGVQFVWVRTPPYQRNDWRRVRNMVAFTIRVWRLGQRVTTLAPDTGRPDVVIGSSPHLLTPLAAYLVSKRYRVPFVMEVRDLWPQVIVDLKKLSKQHPITKALQVLERFLYHQAERIIVLGPQMKEYIAACDISQEKIVWIPNGVDLSRFEGLAASKSPDEVFKVMYLGAHGQANALDGLIHAARVVQDRGIQAIRFILVGDGPEKPRLMALAKELGLRNVDFRAPVPKSEVSETLHESDTFIVNYEKAEVLRYGVSPNKLFDYMAAGRPVIFAGAASNNPVEESRCGFTVPPRDPEALAEAVIRLYQMPQEEQEAMGRRGREYVEKHHAIPRLAEKLMDCLEAVRKP